MLRAKRAVAGSALVRGSAFLGLLGHIRESAGPDALQAIIRDSGPAAGEVFGERIRKLAWYPYSAYAGFLEASDRQCGTGDFGYCVTMGREAGKRDLNTVFGYLSRFYGPERLIRSCSRVWSHYYDNAGRMEAIEWEPQRTVLRIQGFVRMSPAHCRLMEGWMWQAMTVVGGSVIEGMEARCPSRGDPWHEFVCQWRPPE